MDVKKLNFSIFEARLFCTMYKLGSTNEVAKAMEITPSLVSIGINRLEKKLGADKLFLKMAKTGKYVPTQSAKEIVNSMRYIVRFAEETIAQKTKAQKSVMITSTHTILHYYLGPYIKDFLKENPESQVNFKQAKLMDPLNLDINEIALTGFVKDAANKKFIPYHSFRQKLWASPEYIKEYGNPKSIEELKHHTLLLRKDIDNSGHFFGSAYIKSQLDEDDKVKHYDVYSTSLIDYMCQLGCGIMASSKETIKIANFRLENVFPSFKGDEFDLYVCIDKEFFDTPLGKKTINWIYDCRDLLFKKFKITPNFPRPSLD